MLSQHKEKVVIVKNRKGISVLIGYVLLVAGMLLVGGVVYAWIKSYVPTEEIDCPSETSIFLKEANYIMEKTLGCKGDLDGDGDVDDDDAVLLPTTTITCTIQNYPICQDCSPNLYNSLADFDDDCRIDYLDTTQGFGGVYNTLCELADGKLELTLKNTGMFDINGYFIHASNESSRELPTIDLSQYIFGGGTKMNGAVRFKGGSVLSPGKETKPIQTFNLIDVEEIYSVEIIPFRFQTQDNKERLVSCSNAKIKEELCVIPCKKWTLSTCVKEGTGCMGDLDGDGVIEISTPTGDPDQDFILFNVIYSTTCEGTYPNCINCVRDNNPVNDYNPLADFNRDCNIDFFDIGPLNALDDTSCGKETKTCTDADSCPISEKIDCVFKET